MIERDPDDIEQFIRGTVYPHWMPQGDPAEEVDLTTAEPRPESNAIAEAQLLARKLGSEFLSGMARYGNCYITFGRTP